MAEEIQIEITDEKAVLLEQIKELLSKACGI